MRQPNDNVAFSSSSPSATANATITTSSSPTCVIDGIGAVVGASIMTSSKKGGGGGAEDAEKPPPPPPPVFRQNQQQQHQQQQQQQHPLAAAGGGGGMSHPSSVVGPANTTTGVASNDMNHNAPGATDFPGVHPGLLTNPPQPSVSAAAPGLTVGQPPSGQQQPYEQRRRQQRQQQQRRSHARHQSDTSAILSLYDTSNFNVGLVGSSNPLSPPAATAGGMTTASAGGGGGGRGGRNAHPLLAKFDPLLSGGKQFDPLLSGGGGNATGTTAGAAAAPDLLLDGISEHESHPLSSNGAAGASGFAGSSSLHNTDAQPSRPRGPTKRRGGHRSTRSLDTSELRRIAADLSSLKPRRNTSAEEKQQAQENHRITLGSKPKESTGTSRTHRRKGSAGLGDVLFGKHHSGQKAAGADDVGGVVDGLMLSSSVHSSPDRVGGASSSSTALKAASSPKRGSTGGIDTKTPHSEAPASSGGGAIRPATLSVRASSTGDATTTTSASSDPAKTPPSSPRRRSLGSKVMPAVLKTPPSSPRRKSSSGKKPLSSGGGQPTLNTGGSKGSTAKNTKGGGGGGGGASGGGLSTPNKSPSGPSTPKGSSGKGASHRRVNSLPKMLSDKLAPAMSINAPKSPGPAAAAKATTTTGGGVESSRITPQGKNGGIGDLPSIPRLNVVDPTASPLMSSEQDPSLHQIELPPDATDVLLHARICRAFDEYRRVDQNFDFGTLAGLSRMRLDAFVSSVGSGTNSSSGGSDEGGGEGDVAEQDHNNSAAPPPPAPPMTPPMVTRTSVSDTNGLGGTPSLLLGGVDGASSTSTARLLRAHRPIVQSVLECADDLVVEGYFHEEGDGTGAAAVGSATGAEFSHGGGSKKDGTAAARTTGGGGGGSGSGGSGSKKLDAIAVTPAADKCTDDRVEVAIFSSQRRRQFIVAYRGPTELQGKPVRNRDVRAMMKDGSSGKPKNAPANHLHPDQPVTVFPAFRDGYFKTGLEDKVFGLLDELAEAHPFCDVVTTGHSFGAALATIGAVRYAASRPMMRVSCHAFGSPRVGTTEFRQLANSLPNLKVVRVEYGCDPWVFAPDGSSWTHVGHTIVVSATMLAAVGSSMSSPSSHGMSPHGSGRHVVPPSATTGGGGASSAAAALAYKFDKNRPAGGGGFGAKGFMGISMSKKGHGKHEKEDHEIRSYVNAMETFTHLGLPWASTYVGEDVGKGVVMNKEARQVV